MKSNLADLPLSPGKSRWTPALVFPSLILAPLAFPQNRTAWVAAAALLAASFCLPRSWQPARHATLWRLASLASLATFFLCLRQLALQLFP